MSILEALLMSLEPWLNKVHMMDCIDFLRQIPDNSIDSCVTDPPYGLDFMGKKWDSGTITFSSNVWDEVFRVLKSGSHLLAFGGTRTYHRLACAVEDAGFEIRDQIHWVYGSGFPKGQNISKAIDKVHPRITLFDEFARHYEDRRKLVGLTHTQICEEGGFYDKINHGGASSNWGLGLNVPTLEQWRFLQPLLGLSLDFLPLIERIEEEREVIGKYESDAGGLPDGQRMGEKGGDITAPATVDSEKWQGWNTQLKPAHEPIVVARKPISERSIVENVLRWGTGGLNIDGCRIAVNPNDPDIGKTTNRKHRALKDTVWAEENTGKSSMRNDENPLAGILPSGRYPANFVLSHHPDCQLIQEGNTKVIGKPREEVLTWGKYGIYGEANRSPVEFDYSQSEPEKWACVEGCPVRELNEQSGISVSSPVGFKSVGWKHSGNTKDEMTPLEWQREFNDIGGASRFFYCAKASPSERNAGLNGKRNRHITVKPLELMRWLVRLVTARGGVVLDPFLGSGTTAIAAENEGCDWLGCDINEDFCEIAEARIAALGGTQTIIAEWLE